MDINIIKEMLINSDVDSMVYIGKVKDIAEIYYEMLDEDYDFFEEDDYEIENILGSLEGEDIISISINKYDDNDYECFVEEIFNDEGEQIYFDSDVILIDEELLDELDLDVFEGIIVAISMADDIDEDIEDELDDILEDMTEELLEYLTDGELCCHCTIKNTIEEAYAIGYETAWNDAVAEMKEKLNDIDNLLL